MRRVAPWLMVLVLAGCGEPAAPGGGGDDEVAEQIERDLEENRRTLPQDAPSDSPVRERPLPEFVRDYQWAGFFAEEDPGRATARVARAYEREWGEPARVRTRLDELDSRRRRVQGGAAGRLPRPVRAPGRNASSPARAGASRSTGPTPRSASPRSSSPEEGGRAAC